MNENKTKSEKKTISKKTLKVGLIALAVLAFAGASVGCYFIGKNIRNNNGAGDESSSAEVIPGNGVSVKMAFVAATTEDPYGSYVIDYTVTPKIYTDTISAKIAYDESGDAVPSTVMTIDQDSANQRITAHCKGAFTKAIRLTIYASSDESVTAAVVFQFKEKITVTVPDSISLSEGAVPAITPTVTSTGGTITVDKAVKSVTYGWNSSFINWVKEKTQKALDTAVTQATNTNFYSNEAMGSLVGLSADDAASFFATAFSSNTFLTTKGCGYSYDITYIGETDVYPVSTTWHLGSATRADFLAEFDGAHPIFDWSCSINGKSYSKSFGLTLGAIPVQSISAGETSVTF
jgi:hypothetical protein